MSDKCHIKKHLTKATPIVLNMKKCYIKAQLLCVGHATVQNTRSAIPVRYTTYQLQSSCVRRPSRDKKKHNACPMNVLTMTRNGNRNKS